MGMTTMTRRLHSIVCKHAYQDLNFIYTQDHDCTVITPYVHGYKTQCIEASRVTSRKSQHCAAIVPMHAWTIQWTKQRDFKYNM
jgi:hypothetical protein